MTFQKGHKINIGRSFTEEHKRKIGLANSISLKGNTPWNKGKHTGRNEKQLSNLKQQYACGNLVPWNKGKTNVYSEEVRKRMNVSHTGLKQSQETRMKKSIEIKRQWADGIRSKIISDETRLKQSNTRKKLYENGLVHPFKGKHHSQEAINKYKDRRRSWKTPKFDTSIELKIQNFLKQLGIDFFTHQYIKEIEHGYQCDILIPSMNLVIECDGNYWHKYPIGNDIDHIRTSELVQKGFRVLRLWEHDIRKMELNEFRRRVYG